MRRRHSASTLFLVLLVTPFVIAAPAAGEGEALDLFVGRWDARVQTLRPQPSEVTYTEVYEWVLDGKFLRGRTMQKSDGTEDIIIGTYDAQARGYPWWLFSSLGSAARGAAQALPRGGLNGARVVAFRKTHDRAPVPTAVVNRFRHDVGVLRGDTP